MKILSALTLAAVSLPVIASPAPLLENEGRIAIQSLGKQLHERMKHALGNGGLEGAIGACNSDALPLTREISEQSQFDVRRTAERHRNPANAPDAWERGVMTQFKERQLQGQPLKGMMFSDVREENGARVFRMAVAIPTQKQCLACHGESLDAKVEAKINALYPSDTARGFNAGDLRGIFSLKRVL